MHTRNIRLFSIGAQTLTGVGDARGLGWLGRVLAKTEIPDLQIESYPLVFPNETTEEMSDRWEHEVLPRLATEDIENRMIIAVPHDPVAMAGSSARARLHLANILDRAKQHNIATFVVGPTPTQDHETNRHLAQLNEAYQGVAERRDVLYVDAFTDLVNHQNFNEDLMVNEGLPGQAAYGLIAWLVLNRGWFDWLGIVDPNING
ncbi:GDSL-type esterase/lipase family protein [Yaniella flava]|uniref:GDSL-type esterase/lipase family protein n=1 Tax=Yaniella flava TaxID=287930 RepID=UPI0031DAE9D5